MKPRAMFDSGAAARRSQIYFSMHHKDSVHPVQHQANRPDAQKTIVDKEQPKK